MNDHFFLVSSISLFLLGAVFIIMSVADDGISLQTKKLNMEIDLNNRVYQHKIIDLLFSSQLFNVTDFKLRENTWHRES